MRDIKIRRPRLEDIEEMNQFFSTVIIDTFAREGLSYLSGDIENEIRSKNKYFKSDLESNGINRYFLIAFDNEKIVGSIEYGSANELIISITEGKFEEVVEVGTAFVLPDYQKQGIGNLLLNEMYQVLKDKGIEEFCLDSGYTNAQKVWMKKFGNPKYLLKNYWSSSNDHMIWRVKLNDILKE